MGNPLMDRTVRAGEKDSRHMIPRDYVPTAEQLNSQYQMPAAQPQVAAPERPMTYDDVFMKSLACFGVLLVGAAVGWFAVTAFSPVIWIAAIVGLVFGLINSFKKEPSKGLILTYAAVEGVFLGGISHVYESFAGGIVLQAVLATLCVFGVMFCLFKFAGVRMSGGMLKFMMIAVGGYAVFSLINFGLALGTGGRINAFSDSLQISLGGFTFPIGAVIGLVAVVLASMTLISDFQTIEEGVRNRIPERYSWMCAFSLMVTLVWLYLEILRLLSYFRSN